MLTSEFTLIHGPDISDSYAVLFFTPSSDTSTTEHCFCFGPAASFFLELFVIALHFSPVAYWTPSDLGDSFYSVVSFCLFILFVGFLWQEYWSALPFPPPMDHVLSELFALTCLSWVTLHSMARSFIDLCKSLCYDKAVIHEKVLMNMFFFNFFIFLRSTAVG